MMHVSPKITFYVVVRLVSQGWTTARLMKELYMTRYQAQVYRNLAKCPVDAQDAYFSNKLSLKAALARRSNPE